MAYKINTLAKDKKEILANLANDYNFYGKRKRDTRLEAALEVCKDFFEMFNMEIIPIELADWLIENRPVKDVKKQAIEQGDTRPLVGGELERQSEKWEILDGNAWIITSVQNNTKPHKNALSSLKRYAEYLGAKILAFPYTYNLNGFQNNVEDDSIYYDSEIKDLIIEKSVFLGDDKMAAVAVNILPTATYPLSGMGEILPPQASGIFPHAQIALETIPSPKNELARIMYSTGTITLRNYIQRKAGQRAEASHCYGALIVTYKDGVHHVRQLQIMGSDGVFFDIDQDSGKVLRVSPEDVRFWNDAVASLQYGDIHAEKGDNEIAALSWCAENCLLDTLKPKYQIIHDVHDFSSRNHHNRNNADFLFNQYCLNRSVLKDIEDTAETLATMQRNKYGELVIVESNHDLALSRWLTDNDVRISNDPENIEIYHKLNYYKFRDMRKNSLDVGEWCALQFAIDNVSDYSINANWLKVDQRFTVAGVEMGFHGHTGANGSRGNPKQYKRLGVAVNTGHTHSPSIYGSVYTAGVSGKLNMGYNIGMSGWRHAHVVTYVNGQRQLLIKDGLSFY